uniref:RING-type domain-containing protein n=1 Tax=Clastoptera arizonana TaxID=38151 RepID=A0A1B6CMW0_9HEMI
MEEKGVENERLHVLESRFECPICLLCLKDPILTTCGHRFCGNCIHKWLKDQNGSCPIDGQVLSINNDLFPDNYTKREIAHQKVTCPVNGCTQELPLIDAENHIAELHEVCFCCDKKLFRE